MSDGVTGNTSDFGSEDSRFDSWSDNGINEIFNHLEEGTLVPFFFAGYQMEVSKISEMVTGHLAGSDKFLVEVLVKPGNRIHVFIDGDQGVTIDDCVGVSRFLESQMDREVQDYELNVSSAGADQPIKLPRQYLKNIGRSLKVKLTEEKEMTGLLSAVDEKGIVIQASGDKKKKIKPEPIHLDYGQIMEAKVIISFK